MSVRPTQLTGHAFLSQMFQPRLSPDERVKAALANHGGKYLIGKAASGITPEEFELEVKAIIEAAGYELPEFKTAHRQVVAGADGDYEIDIVAEFKALGARFKVLIECKRYSSRIKREVVELLHGRVKSVGAQKGIVFATAEFQSGALEYAKQHGIALISVIEGRSTYFTKSFGSPPGPEPPPWLNIPKYVGLWTQRIEDSNTSFKRVSRDEAASFREIFEAEAG